jgi:hypothetical protein
MSIRFQASDQKLFYSPTVGGSASTLAVGLRVKVDVEPSGGNRYVLFGDVGEAAWAVEVLGGQFYLSFWVGGVWTYFAPAVTTGQVYDLVMVQAPNAQTFYVNGVQVGSGSAAGSLGAFSLSLASAQGALWSTETVVPDVTIDRPWVASSAPTADDVVALRDGTKTPADVFGANLLFWLSLDGTAGQVPAAADPGLTGQGGTSTTVSVNGSPTYAASLAYVAPVYATPYTTPDGKGLYLQFFKTADNTPSNGGGNNNPVTISTHPTVQYNGGAATAVSTPGALPYDNHALYKLPTPLAANDVLTVTSSGGAWASTADGDAAALVAAVAPRRAILPSPAATKTMKIGWNTPAPGLEFALTPLRANWFDYSWLATGFSGGYTLDANGQYPIALNGTVYYYVAGNPESSSTVRTGLPTPEGNYTVKWKCTTGATLSIWEANGVGTLTQVGTDTTDPDGSHVRVYSLVMPDTGRYDAQIYLKFTQAGGTCDLSDVRFYPPGEPTDGSATYSANLKRQLGPAPASLRYMDALYTNASNVTLFSQIGAGSATTTLNITSIAPGTQGTFLTCQGPIRLTSSAPHGLADGMYVTLGTSSQWDALTWSNTNGGANWTLSGLPGIVKVVDATTFEVRVWMPTTLTQSATFTATLPTVTMVVNGTISVADMIGLAAWVGADPHVNLPHLMPPAEVTKFCDALFAALPAGRTLWLEFSNECWNGPSIAFQQYFYFQGLASVNGTNADAEYARVASAAFDAALASAASAAKSSQLKRVMGGFWAGTGRTTNIVAWCTANSKTFDALAVAPYFDAGPADAAYQAWWEAADHDLMFDAAELFLTRDYSHNNNTTVHASIIAPITGAVVVGYEGGLEKLRATYTTADQEDCYFLPYHPRAAEVFADHASRQQAQGMTRYNLYELTNPCGFGGASWGAYTSPTTAAGVGDGSDGLNNNVATGFDEKRVVSVVGHAANLWMAAQGVPVTASGGTFAQLQSMGLWGWLDLLAQANGLPAATWGDLHRVALTDEVFLRAAGLASSFVRGDPVSVPALASEVADASLVFAVVARALNEAYALVNANPGSLVESEVRTCYARTTRVFP